MLLITVLQSILFIIIITVVVVVYCVLCYPVHGLWCVKVVAVYIYVGRVGWSGAVVTVVHHCQRGFAHLS